MERVGIGEGNVEMGLEGRGVKGRIGGRDGMG